MAEQNVVISEDLCRDLGQFLEGLDYDRLFVLTDENTFANCYPLLKPVEAIASAPVITVKAGDTHKSLEALASIWTRLSNKGATRHSLLLNLGGGMVTDMGGFAGATFKRGIRTINVPTTLMASVDAAVGGKTGINFNGLKNEIGSFYPPLRVFIDCGFLRTLDYDNILSGYAEMVKHGLISSMEDYASVLLYDIDTMNYSYLNRLVAQSVAVKERIVAEDPKEHGIRKALNFGHTIGHAVEKLKEFTLCHGECVAIGSVAAAWISRERGYLTGDELLQIEKVFQNYHLPVRVGGLEPDRILEATKLDKKMEAGKIKFVLLKKIGEAFVAKDVEDRELLGAIRYVCEENVHE